MKTVPVFPLLTAPAEWDELTLLAATDFLEAEGEPEAGQLAVAWVIRNRADRWHQTLHEVILKPMQFSCFNADYWSTVGQARLVAAGDVPAERCWRAAAVAYWKLVADPSGGADHYANVALTKKLRKDGTLPDWLQQAITEGKETAQIGQHTFFRLG